uniref:Protein sleepless n=1 Tax=Globodera rostochiensis TaxID=31243 RepID=A0A914I018_GLORO
MHSKKSKQTRSPMLIAVHSPGLPLAAICLLSALLLDQMIGTTGLKCYQTQSSLTQPIQGSATDCPMLAWSCIKSVDYSQALVTRACQSNNCSMLGGSNSPICQNSSSYPPQTFCCCYGDGCNSALRFDGPLALILIVAAGALAIGSAKWR